MKSFFSMMISSQNEALAFNNKKKLDACNRLEKFVVAGKYTKISRAKVILANYSKTTLQLSKETGVSEATIKTAKRRLSCELYDVFGWDFFTLFNSKVLEEYEEALVRLSIAEMGISSSELVLFDTLKEIPVFSSESKQFDVKECSEEAKFLAMYSKPMLDSKLETLDKEKLSFLIGVLDREAGSLKDTCNFINFIKRKSSM